MSNLGVCSKKRDPLTRVQTNFESEENCTGAPFVYTVARNRANEVFERQTILQSVTEFAWFRVNGLQNFSGPAGNLSVTKRFYIFDVFAFKIKVIIIWKMIQ